MGYYENEDARSKNEKIIFWTCLISLPIGFGLGELMELTLAGFIFTSIVVMLISIIAVSLIEYCID